jgi:heavy metal translocating P-type ATPase
MAQLHWKIGGMHCSFCSQTIKRGLERMHGVQHAAVSLPHEEALVAYDAEKIDDETLRQTLRRLGYTLRDPNRTRAYEQQRSEQHAKGWQTVIGGVASALVAVVMAAMWLGLPPLPQWALIATGVLAGSIVFGAGRHIVAMALAGLRRRIFNQHVLLLFGAVGAFAAGLLGLALPSFPAFHFFSAAIFLMTYHLLSGYVATVVHARSQEAVRRLLELQPETARRISEGQEAEIPLDEVQVGDHLRIRPGERIPLDGRIIEGQTTVDASLVTGEPMPADKTLGDQMLGGSINQTGTLVVEASVTHEGGFLQRVARQVESSRALKPGVIQLVDWILKYYVPAVLLIGFGALLLRGPMGWLVTGSADWSRALYAMLTVYVMGYPCALGMATPLALIRGGTLAAERGILMRSGEAFQVFQEIDTVVLDKTGTITEGRPRLQSVGASSGLDRHELLRIAAAAEQHSEHPLARAVVERAEAEALKLPPAQNFEAVTGLGARAEVEGREVLIGRPALLEQAGIDFDEAQAPSGRMRQQGQTVVWVAIDGRLAGVLGLADRIKRDSTQAIAQLQAMNVQAVMLTGDNAQTARAVAEQVGIQRVVAEVLPAQKAERIGELQAEDRRVAMVGDGINDAPALTRADVGLAIGAGTDIAIESADVVLMNSRLSGVVAAFEVSRNSYRKTKQNLIVAFLFNGIGVPIAATGLLHPIWAMAAMVASVSLVLLNSFGGRLVGSRVANEVQTAPETGQTETVREVELRTADMHCEGCERAAVSLLKQTPDVLNAEADRHTGRIRVRVRGDHDDPQLAERLAAGGFSVS